MTANNHPELTDNNRLAIHQLLMSLAHDARGPRGRIRREDMLMAAQQIAEELQPPVRAEDVLKYVMGTVSSKKSAKVKENPMHQVDLGNRTLVIKVDRTPKSQLVVETKEPEIRPNGTGKSGKIVSGNDDPFSEENQSLFKRLLNELAEIEKGQTFQLPAKDWQEAQKMREILHAVSKKLGWIAVPYESGWKAYLVTIKEMSLYVRRLG